MSGTFLNKPDLIRVLSFPVAYIKGYQIIVDNLFYWIRLSFSNFISQLCKKKARHIYNAGPFSLRTVLMKILFFHIRHFLFALPGIGSFIFCHQVNTCFCNMSKCMICLFLFLECFIKQICYLVKFHGNSQFY